MSGLKDIERKEKIELRVGTSLYPSQHSAIEQLLVELKDRCSAQFILLSDTSGLFVMAHGKTEKIDLTALSTLVAGDMAASREIAQRTGHYKSYQLVLREGRQASSFIAEAGEYLLLFVQVTSDVPLGWARLLIREAGRQISEIMDTAPDQVEELDLGLNDEKLKNAVDGALDSMWIG